MMNAFGPLAANRVALGAAPQPQTAAGVGQFINLTPADGAALVLPAGGNWKYAARCMSVAGGTLVIRDVGGIAAGGSQVGGPNAGAVWLGWAERIS